VFHVSLIVNNYDFDELDYLDAKNVHFLISLYSGSLTIVVINKYIKQLQVRTQTSFCPSVAHVNGVRVGKVKGAMSFLERRRVLISLT